jgi:hypothetical protein
VYALHDAVDMPAMLPDGSTTERSVSRAMTQRDIDLRRDPRAEVAADLEAEAKVAPELPVPAQVEAGARGGSESE